MSLNAQWKFPSFTIVWRNFFSLIQHYVSSSYTILQYKLLHVELAQMRQPTDNTSGCDKYILINTCILQYLYSSPAWVQRKSQGDSASYRIPLSCFTAIWNLLDVFAGSLSNSTYFHPGLHFIINVKFELAKLLFNNAFVIRDQASWRG